MPEERKMTSPRKKEIAGIRPTHNAGQRPTPVVVKAEKSLSLLSCSQSNGPGTGEGFGSVEEAGGVGGGESKK